jgi:hypothetical protein
VPGQDHRASGAALAPPDPPLRRALVALRPWRAADVPDGLTAFADPLPASAAVTERCGFPREGVPRSHMVSKGGRRDTVPYPLPPGGLR